MEARKHKTTKLDPGHDRDLLREEGGEENRVGAETSRRRKWGDISVASEVTQRTCEDWGPKPSQVPNGSQTKFSS